MTDIFKTAPLEPTPKNSSIEKLHENLRLDQQRQNMTDLEELRLEEEKVSIFEGEKQQVVDQLKTIGSITVAQLESLLAKAGTMSDTRVLAVIRALLEEKRIEIGSLANDAVKALEHVDFENPIAEDRKLVNKIKHRFPLSIEKLKL